MVKRKRFQKGWIPAGIAIKFLIALSLLMPPLAYQPAIALAQPASVGYKWQVMNAGGGSFTLGLYFHPLNPNVRYMRTGDTGAYRWVATAQRWTPMTDWTTNEALSSYVEALAVDPGDVNVVYYAAGDDASVGDVFKSLDGGITFAPTGLKRRDASGNLVLNGSGEQQAVRIRGAKEASVFGERMMADPNNRNVIYYASQRDGLYKSVNGAGAWNRVTSLSAAGDTANTYNANGSVQRVANERGGLSFVAFDKNGGTVTLGGQSVSKYIYVGVYGDRRSQSGNGASVTQHDEGGVWRSGDGGQTWSKLTDSDGAELSPCRIDIAADGTLYVGTDNGVYKASRTATTLQRLTLPYGGGIHAVAVDPTNSSHVIAGRFGEGTNEQPYKPESNGFYRSTDGGSTWSVIDSVHTPRVQWWHAFAAHTSFLMFDPINPKSVWFGDWVDPWKTDDITASTVHWEQMGDGHDGSYSNSLAATPFRSDDSEAILFSSGVDYGGFRFVNPESPPLHKLTQRNPTTNSGLGDGTSVSVFEQDPQFVAAVGGFNHGTHGGGGASSNNGQIWSDFTGFGLSWDKWSTSIKLGQIAIGATRQTNGYPILVHNPRFHVPRYSLDYGMTWNDSTGAVSGTAASEWEADQALAADKVNGNTFYLVNPGVASGTAGAATVYRSTNGGVSWTQVSTITYDWNGRMMQDYHLETTPGKQGDLWLTLRDPYGTDSKEGLWHSTDGGETWTFISGLGDVMDTAIGAPGPGRTNLTLYVSQYVNGVPVIWRSNDALSLTGNLSAATWEEIYNFNAYPNAKSINRGLRLIEADREVYGRLYVGANARGVWYGVPDTNNLPPRVRLTSPNNHARTYTGNTPLEAPTFAAGGAIPLTAYAGDLDGSISKVEYFKDGTLIGSSTSGPDYATSWQNAPAGTYAITAKAIDNNGASTVSHILSIKVESGSGTGLPATYYDNDNFTGTTATRKDASIQFEWWGAAPAPGISADTFSVRWTGRVEAPETGDYLFQTRSDDGVRLWINGQQLINNWTGHSATDDTSPVIGLVKGQKYELKLEYYEGAGDATIQLKWKRPGSNAFQFIPADRLYEADSVQVIAANRFGSAGIGSSTYDKASDGDTATAFDAADANGGYAGIDAGSSKVVKKIRYLPRIWMGSRMIGGKFQGGGSQNGPWTDLYTVPVAPTDWVSVDLPNNNTAYRYYRYVGPNEGHSNIGEMEFWGLP